MVPEDAPDRRMSWGKTLAYRGLYWLGFTYVLFSLLYGRFYDAFGVSSPDVGLGPAQGIGDVVLGVVRVGVWLTVMLLTVTLIAFGCCVALAFVAERCATVPYDDGKDPRRMHRLARRIGVTSMDLSLAVLVAGGLWLFAFEFLGPVSPPLQWFVFISIGVVPVGWWIYIRTRKVLWIPSPTGGRPGFRLWETTRRQQVAGLLTIYAFATSALVFADLWGDAADAAREAQTRVPQCAVPDIRQPLPSWVSSLHIALTVLAVRAEPAIVGWIGSDAPPGLLTTNSTKRPILTIKSEERPIFLGAANGSTFVAVRNRSGLYHAVRVPDAKVVLGIDKSVPRCSSAH